MIQLEPKIYFLLSYLPLFNIQVFMHFAGSISGNSFIKFIPVVNFIGCLNFTGTSCIKTNTKSKHSIMFLK